MNTPNVKPPVMVGPPEVDDPTNVPSYVHVQFAAFSSTLMETQFSNVTPLQILALASYLEFVGKSQLAKLEAQRQEKLETQKLTVPNGKVLRP